jgi:hypothetical protein
MTTQKVIAALGVWLSVSAVIWHDDAAQLYTALSAGIGMVASALAWRAGVSCARWVNVALAVWLCATTIALPIGNPQLVLNRLVVGTIVLFLSFLPPPAVTDYHGAGIVPQT